LSVAEDLELVLHPRPPLELDRQEPNVGSGDLLQLKIILPELDAMTQIERIRRSSRGKRAEVTLDHGKGVLFEEGRGGGLPLLLVRQRGKRRPQLVDCQDLVAAHRGDSIRSRQRQ
jgi:hypothetical protein